MLKQGLKRIVDKVQGSIGITLIGVDGMPIAEYKKGGSLHMGTVGAELTLVYKNAIKLTKELEFGSLQELTLVAEKTAVICRAVTDEYYLLLAISPQALMGKGRYQLKKAVAEFREQLLL
jgi:predicted regulator of Ras-like GTPase activity (Roadblock/LC7/MglB family)